MIKIFDKNKDIKYGYIDYNNISELPIKEAELSYFDIVEPLKYSKEICNKYKGKMCCFTFITSNPTNNNYNDIDTIDTNIIELTSNDFNNGNNIIEIYGKTLYASIYKIYYKNDENKESFIMNKIYKISLVPKLKNNL